MEIQTRYDHRRGCGWRRTGGKYLVGGVLNHACGKLPLRLERCPVCDHGIKPARGWTWIGADHLFASGPCGDTACATCVLCTPPARAGLLWIGATHYATPEAFIREAARLGISRRIARIPHGLVIGETVVLLAHREVALALGADPVPAIVAAFVPQAIEYIVRGDESAEELERLEHQGCTLVRIERIEDGGVL